MFMFVFSVLTISIVGLFFQIVSAMTGFLLNQQFSLGEQMLRWHAQAYQFSCTTAGKAEPSTYTIVYTDFLRSGELSGSYKWNSKFFCGTWSGAQKRMIVTYITPNESPSGYSSYEAGRQVTTLTTKQFYRFTRSNASQETTFSTMDGGSVSAVLIGGLPSEVLPNSVVLVSDASCDRPYNPSDPCN